MEPRPGFFRLGHRLISELLREDRRGGGEERQSEEGAAGHGRVNKALGLRSA
jgi:hypothetical protein